MSADQAENLPFDRHNEANRAIGLYLLNQLAGQLADALESNAATALDDLERRFLRRAIKQRLLPVLYSIKGEASSILKKAQNDALATSLRGPD
jgi:hypothetical protein